jgi:hypothetical protein
MVHRCGDRWNHQDLQSSISSGETITIKHLTKPEALALAFQLLILGAPLNTLAGIRHGFGALFQK